MAGEESLLHLGVVIDGGGVSRFAQEAEQSLRRVQELASRPIETTVTINEVRKQVQETGQAIGGAQQQAIQERRSLPENDPRVAQINTELAGLSVAAKELRSKLAAFPGLENGAGELNQAILQGASRVRDLMGKQATALEAGTEGQIGIARTQREIQGGTQRVATAIDRQAAAATETADALKRRAAAEVELAEKTRAAGIRAAESEHLPARGIKTQEQVEGQAKRAITDVQNLEELPPTASAQQFGKAGALIGNLQKRFETLAAGIPAASEIREPFDAARASLVEFAAKTKAAAQATGETAPQAALVKGVTRGEGRFGNEQDVAKLQERIADINREELGVATGTLAASKREQAATEHAAEAAELNAKTPIHTDPGITDSLKRTGIAAETIAGATETEAEKALARANVEVPVVPLREIRTPLDVEHQVRRTVAAVETLDETPIPDTRAGLERRGAALGDANKHVEELSKVSSGALTTELETAAATVQRLNSETLDAALLVRGSKGNISAFNRAFLGASEAAGQIDPQVIPGLLHDVETQLQGVAGEEGKLKAATTGSVAAEQRGTAAREKVAAETEQEVFYHGTATNPLAGGGVIAPQADKPFIKPSFPSETDPSFAYATRSKEEALHYAELSSNARDTGYPRVFKVAPTGPVEPDPAFDETGRSRGNFPGDVRSRQPFKILAEETLPYPFEKPGDFDPKFAGKEKEIPATNARLAEERRLEEEKIKADQATVAAKQQASAAVTETAAIETEAVGQAKARSGGGGRRPPPPPPPRTPTGGGEEPDEETNRLIRVAKQKQAEYESKRAEAAGKAASITVAGAEAEAESEATQTRARARTRGRRDGVPPRELETPQLALPSASLTREFTVDPQGEAIETTKRFQRAEARRRAQEERLAPEPRNFTATSEGEVEQADRKAASAARRNASARERQAEAQERVASETSRLPISEIRTPAQVREQVQTAVTDVRQLHEEPPLPKTAAPEAFGQLGERIGEVSRRIERLGQLIPESGDLRERFRAAETGIHNVDERARDVVDQTTRATANAKELADGFRRGATSVGKLDETRVGPLLRDVEVAEAKLLEATRGSGAAAETERNQRERTASGGNRPPLPPSRPPLTGGGEPPDDGEQERARREAAEAQKRIAEELRIAAEAAGKTATAEGETATHAEAAAGQQRTPLANIRSVEDVNREIEASTAQVRSLRTRPFDPERIEQTGADIGEERRRLEQLKRVTPPESGPRKDINKGLADLREFELATEQLAVNTKGAADGSRLLREGVTRGAETAGKLDKDVQPALKDQYKEDQTRLRAEQREEQAAGRGSKPRLPPIDPAEKIQRRIERDLSDAQASTEQADPSTLAGTARLLKAHADAEAAAVQDVRVRRAQGEVQARTFTTQQGIEEQTSLQFLEARAAQAQSRFLRRPDIVGERAATRVESERTRATHENAFLSGQTSQDYALNASNDVLREQRNLAEAVQRRAILESSSIDSHRSVGQELIEGQAAEAAAAKADAAQKAKFTNEALAVNRRYIEGTAEAAEAQKQIAARVGAATLGGIPQGSRSDAEFQTQIGGQLAAKQARERVQADLEQQFATSPADIEAQARRGVGERSIAADRTIATGQVLDEVNQDTGKTARAELVEAEGQAAAEKRRQAEAIKAAVAGELASKDLIDEIAASQAEAAAATKRLAVATEGAALGLERRRGTDGLYVEEEAAFAARVSAQKRIAASLEKTAQREANKAAIEEAEGPGGPLGRGTFSQRLRRDAQYRRTGEYKPAEEVGEGGGLLSGIGGGGSIAQLALFSAGFAAVTQIKGMVTEAENAQKAAVALRLEYEALGDSKSFGKAQEGLLALARDTGISADAALKLGTTLRGVYASADAQGNVPTADVANAKALASAGTAAQFSKATGVELKTVVDQLTAASLAYGQDFQQISDKTYGLSQRFGQDPGELLSTIGKLAPVAKQYGFELSQLGGIIAAAARASGRGTDAIGADLGRVIPEIQNQIGKILAVYQDPRLSQGRRVIEQGAAKGRFGDVFTQLLRDVPKFDPQQQERLVRDIGGTRGAQDVAPIFQNYAAILKETDGNINDAGKSQQRFDEYSKTLAATLDRLREQIKQIGISLGNAGLLSALTDVATFFGVVVGAARVLTDLFAELNKVTGGLAGRLIEVGVAMKIIAALRPNAGTAVKETVAVGEGEALAESAATGGVLRRSAARVGGAGVAAGGFFRGAPGRFTAGRDQALLNRGLQAEALGDAAGAEAAVAGQGFTNAGAGLGGGLVGITGLSISTLGVAAAVAGTLELIHVANQEKSHLEDIRKTVANDSRAADTQKLKDEVEKYNNRGNVEKAAQAVSSRVDDIPTPFAATNLVSQPLLIADVAYKKLFPGQNEDKAKDQGQKDELKRRQQEAKDKERDAIVAQLNEFNKIGLVQDPTSRDQFGDLLKTQGVSNEDAGQINFKEKNFNFKNFLDLVGKQEPGALKVAKELLASNKLTPDQKTSLDAIVKKQSDKTKDATQVATDIEQAASDYSAGRLSLPEYQKALTETRNQYDRLLSQPGLDPEQAKQYKTQSEKFVKLSQQLSLKAAQESIQARTLGSGITAQESADVLARELTSKRPATRDEIASGTPANLDQVTDPEQITSTATQIQQQLITDRDRRISLARDASTAFNIATTKLGVSPETLAAYEKAADQINRDHPERHVNALDFERVATPEEQSKLLDGVVAQQLQTTQAQIALTVSKSRSPENRAAGALQGAQAGLLKAQTDQANHEKDRLAQLTKDQQAGAVASKAFDDANAALLTGGSEAADPSGRLPAGQAAQHLETLRKNRDEILARIKNDQTQSQDAINAVDDANAKVNDAARAFADAIFQSSQALSASKSSLAQAQHRPDDALAEQKKGQQAALANAEKDKRDLEANPLKDAGQQDQAVRAAQDKIDIANNQIAATEAAQGDRARQFADATRTLAKSRSSNPLERAAIDINQANDDIARSTGDQVAHQIALAKLADALKSQEALENAFQDSVRTLAKASTNDVLKKAAIDIDQANADIIKAKDDKTARNIAIAELLNAQNAQQKLLVDLANSRLELQSSASRLTGDQITTAQNQLAAAQNNLNLAVRQGQSEQELNRLKAAVNDARGAAFQAEIDSTSRHIGTDLELKRISTAEAINRLRNEEAQLKLKGDVNKDQFDSIELEIQRLLHTSQQDRQFNLPTNLSLPTLYESRRVAQTPGGSSGYQDNRQQSVVLYVNNGMDQAAAVQFLQDSLGVSAPRNAANKRY